MKMKMKICFCSSLYLEEEKMIKKATSQLNISSHKLIDNLIEGLEYNMGEPNHLINILEVPSYPKYKQILFREKKWNHCANTSEEDIEIGFLNLIGIKYLLQTISLVKHLDLWIKSQNDTKLVICSYGRRLAHVIAINHIKRKYPYVTTCMILGDLSGKYVGSISTAEGNSLKAKFLNKLLDYQVQQSLCFDCFVLLTKYMADALDIKKPYCVIEGIAKKPHKISEEKADGTKKIVLYAGALELQYGILDLIDAFEMITLKDYELWLYGSGSASAKVRERAKSNKNIYYNGVVSSGEVLKAYALATVLVNPRKNNGIYTKYSFPSKTMEFLASGKPVIGYKLDGIPEEYNEYIQYVRDDSIRELSMTITRICELSLDERGAVGEKGKRFIFECKNAKKQCEKMVELFTQLQKVKL